MDNGPKKPFIYEINTWVWLDELSRQEGRSLTLDTIPEAQWDRIAALGFDTVWFMGVWERSPEGIRISMANEGLIADFRRALPDFSASDNVGSPYCVRRYVVDPHLGGPGALAGARRKLAERGMRLLLDFVPNHVAPDHPWVTDHPEYFIQGTDEDLKAEPLSFVSCGGNVFACGRDPYFPAWADVLQLNGFDAGLRSAVMDTLDSIAGQCDGVRCDMAMLLMNAIFERTWGSRAGSTPEQDYWPEVIPVIKKKHPGFQFIAEAYWDLEWELQQQGFDFCYDKRLYDRLEHDPAESVRLHLCAEHGYQNKLVRFLENHDEPRAASAFSPEKHRVAAITALTVPGARLIHEGQMEGRTIRLPVFLARRPQESANAELQTFYRQLLETLHKGAVCEGSWSLCERSGWPDNGSYLNLVSWCWQNPGRRWLIVVNLSDSPSQGLVRLPWGDLGGRTWRLKDAFTGEIYDRNGEELSWSGLYVELPPWGFHVLEWA